MFLKSAFLLMMIEQDTFIFASENNVYSYLIFINKIH